MSWFSRRKHKVEALGPAVLQTGVYRSPGLTRLGKELDRRRPESILDLGPSSTENVNFFSRYTTNLCIQDLFHGACHDTGRRSTAFRFGAAETLEFPALGDRFDVVLMWDLIHYFAPEERRRFVARLARYCQPNAFVFLLGSSITSIPLVPIHFKIEDEQSLFYTVSEDERMEPGGLTTRLVEGLMDNFEPLRCFQLRNGLQEFLFRYDGGETAFDDETVADSKAVSEGPPTAPGESVSQGKTVSANKRTVSARKKPPADKGPSTSRKAIVEAKVVGGSD